MLDIPWSCPGFHLQVFCFPRCWEPCCWTSGKGRARKKKSQSFWVLEVPKEQPQNSHCWQFQRGNHGAQSGFFSAFLFCTSRGSLWTDQVHLPTHLPYSFHGDWVQGHLLEVKQDGGTSFTDRTHWAHIDLLHNIILLYCRTAMIVSCVADCPWYVFLRNDPFPAPPLMTRQNGCLACCAEWIVTLHRRRAGRKRSQHHGLAGSMVLRVSWWLFRILWHLQAQREVPPIQGWSGNQPWFIFSVFRWDVDPTGRGGRGGPRRRRPWSKMVSDFQTVLPWCFVASPYTPGNLEMDKKIKKEGEEINAFLILWCW